MQPTIVRIGRLAKSRLIRKTVYAKTQTTAVSLVDQSPRYKLAWSLERAADACLVVGEAVHPVILAASELSQSPQRRLVSVDDRNDCPGTLGVVSFCFKCTGKIALQDEELNRK